MKNSWIVFLILLICGLGYYAGYKFLNKRPKLKLNEKIGLMDTHVGRCVGTVKSKLFSYDDNIDSYLINLKCKGLQNREAVLDVETVGNQIFYLVY